MALNPSTCSRTSRCVTLSLYYNYRQCQAGTLEISIVIFSAFASSESLSMYSDPAIPCWAAPTLAAYRTLVLVSLSLRNVIAITLYLSLLILTLPCTTLCLTCSVSLWPVVMHLMGVRLMADWNLADLDCQRYFLFLSSHFALSQSLFVLLQTGVSVPCLRTVFVPCCELSLSYFYYTLFIGVVKGLTLIYFVFFADSPVVLTG